MKNLPRLVSSLPRHLQSVGYRRVYEIFKSPTSVCIYVLHKNLPTFFFLEVGLYLVLRGGERVTTVHGAASHPVYNEDCKASELTKSAQDEVESALLPQKQPLCADVLKYVHAFPSYL